MNTAPLDGGRNPRQLRRLDRNRVVEANRGACLIRPDECNRQPRDIPLFPSKAGPERPIQNGSERFVRWQLREVAFAAGACVVQMVRKMRVNRRCNPACRGVRNVSQQSVGNGADDGSRTRDFLSHSQALYP